MLRHVMLLALIPDPEGSRDVPQSAAELRGTAVQRPYMNWVLYPAVIFSTHFVSTKRGQRLETGGHQQSSNWGIPEELTLSQPGLTMCFNATLSPQAEGDWVRKLLSSTARRVRGGQRSCRWAQESAGSPLRGQCGEGRVGLGTSVHPSCHSTPRTLDCAKHCSNTVIWTKNIGLSFLLPFF